MCTGLLCVLLSFFSFFFNSLIDTILHIFFIIAKRSSHYFFWNDMSSFIRLYFIHLCTLSGFVIFTKNEISNLEETILSLKNQLPTSFFVTATSFSADSDAKMCGWPRMNLGERLLYGDENNDCRIFLASSVHGY